MRHDRTTFHGTSEWKRARRIAKIEAGYTCARCGAFLPGKGALHVHHKKPVAKSMAVALEPLNLVPLCPACHNATHAELKRPKTQCDEQGWPIDRDHPWFK
jgi:5-methylcytosine-specific restriction endonuclease McrA